ncbi:MAG: TetR/AcrR family transcriptional regulator [Halomonas sp.]|nr:TetR/AcrR family transcriptional regulator [Halomonas sp.]TVP44630.1 MAG: TetR/AcrR family transcriptional regulator [Halomonas sp.]
MNDIATAIDDRDHRTRTAEKRRSAMRRRLVESAMVVFAEKGADATVIDDVIRAAEVSRGTFYKYFASIHDLMVAVSEELGNELLAYVEERVSTIPDPVERVALGLRLFINTALAFPLFASFIRASGLEAAGPTTLIYEYLPAHLTEAIDQGLLLDAPLAVHLDLITGVVLICIARQGADTLEPEHIRQVVASIMRGLGLPADDAWRIANNDIAPLGIPEDSLLMRAHRRLATIERLQ